MKRIFLSLVCFLTACHSIFGYDTEFKNPIFYQPLRPLSRTSTWTYLTPTSYVTMSPLDKNDVILQCKCDLIENKQDRITLKCNGEWDDGSKYSGYFTYVVKNLYTSNCLLVSEQTSALEKFPEYVSYTNYCITPPENAKLKSD